MVYGDLIHILESLEAWPDAPFPEPDSKALVARLSIENPLPETRMTVRDELYALREPDGPARRGTHADGPGVLIIAPSATEAFSVRFDVPADFTPDGWAFIVGQPDRIMELIPLDGMPVPTVRYPIELEVSARGRAQGDGTGCRQRLQVRVGEASVRIDPGVGLSTQGEVAYVTDRRVLAGHRFLVVSPRVTNRGGRLCGGGRSNLDDSDFELLVDDEVLAPVSSTNEVLAVGESIRVPVMFEVPVDAATVEFSVGAGRRRVRVPIPWEDLPTPAGETVASEG